MPTANAGAISVSVTADSAQFESSMDRSAAAAERMSQRTQRAQAAAQAQGDKFVQSIQRQIDSFGLTGTALLRYEAGLKGVSDQASPLIDRLERMKDAAAAFNAEAGRAGGTAALPKGLNDIEEASGRATHGIAGMTRELLVLGHEASQGNYKRLGGSLIVLAEMLTPLAASIGAILVPIAAVGAGVLAFGAAALVGAHETTLLNNALQLTGNFAGVTQGQITAMSRSIAAETGRGIGAARSALEELVKTGDIGPRILGPAATAVVQLEKLTGQSSEEIVKDFAKMGEGVAKWAEEHNRQLNFITAAQYAYIKQLEETGQKEAAEAETLRILNDHLKTLTPNLGYLEAAWKGVGEWASKAWDAMKGVGRAETAEDRLAAATEKVNNLKTALATEAGGGRFGVQTEGRTARLQKLVQGAQDEEGIAQSDVRMGRLAASIQATTAAREKAGIASVDYFSKMLQEAKGANQLAKDLEQLHAQIAARVAAGGPEHTPDDSLIEAYIRHKDRSLADKATAKGVDGFENLMKQVTGLDAVARAELAASDADEKVNEAHKLGAKIAEDYAAGLLKITPAQFQLLDAALKVANASERANEARQAEIKWAAEANAANAVTVENLQKRSDELNKQATVADRAVEVYGLTTGQLEAYNSALLRQQAAEDMRLAALADDIDFTGQLSKAYTDQAKALLNIADAHDRLAGKQRSGQAALDSFFQRYQEDASNTARVTATLAEQGTKVLEDSLTALLTGQKTNFHSMVDALVAEITRLTIVKPLLADIYSAMSGQGSGGGSLSWISTLLSLGSSVLGGGSTIDTAGMGVNASAVGYSSAAHYAQGTNYVPNDGPAYLHKGEAVIPASINAAGGHGRTNHYHVNVQASPGMSRATALQQGRDIAEGIRTASSRNG